MNDQAQAATPGWDPFGHALFDSPSARALSRVGVVDVGSNSVRLVIFDGAARSPAFFYNEKVMCGLGAGLAESGLLNPEGKLRALGALRRFQQLAEGIGLPPLTAVATAAVREASDGAEFRNEVLRETGIKLWVIDGNEEARLSAQGVLLGWPGAYGLVCDLGGASMELAEVNAGRIGKRLSAPLGPLRLTHLPGGRKGREAHIKTLVQAMAEHMGPQRDRLFLVGGSWRAIAQIDMARRNYPLPVLHEYRMSTRGLRETQRFIEDTDPDRLRRLSGVSAARLALVPIAMDVLIRLLREFRPRDVAISSYGIREGLLYEHMPQHIRERDPLVESCHFSEAKDARMPGFGKTLFNFVMPLFKTVPETRIRLIKAACLLHDVSWRAHPNYRAEVCFDNATRANLGGLDHAERVFLGMALLYRYSNKSEGTRFERLCDLLDERGRREAIILGKAMRFGAMLWMQKDSPMAALRWFPRKRVLELHLTRAASALYGEAAEARFRSLARSLEAEPALRLRA